MDLFAIPIHHGKLDLPLDNLRNRLDNLFQQCDRGVWAGETGLSTGQLGLDLHQYPEVSSLVDAIMPRVHEYWEVLHYVPATLEVESCWANQHSVGDRTQEHGHCDGHRQTHVASVFYVEKVEGADLEFINPLDYIHKMTPLAGEQGDMLMSESIASKTGDFFLFPGWMRHRTSPTKNKRIAISINFKGVW
jgi:hypothetical protein|tara:strand:- start:300 stop:872 length:573 start_codon:yes stop_codon:yes gene_type:complete